MRPVVGVVLELIALAFILLGTAAVPSGLGRDFYLLVAQFVTAYLIHCPAHYAVGRLFGIRFRSISLGRTTLVRALPPAFKRLGRLLPILTLALERSSLPSIAKSRIKAMYLSGTIASSGSAIAFAATVTATETWLASILTWALAFAYLLFDIVFSPKSGDVMRARKVGL